MHARWPADRWPSRSISGPAPTPWRPPSSSATRWRSSRSGSPAGVDYAIVYDTTPFIVESVNEVFNTLRDAVILVAFVVLLFLQNWRSAIIPLVAVPVAIVGTFAVMAALGFSLNNLTLFGLVLAIGIVVDDAIVVVEAVEHHIEHGLAPREATITAMSQVSAPVIAVGLVLTAVFVPCAFITGITGQFYRQFALTIATSTVISAFNSLTLSPALAALLLRPRQKGVFQALPWPAFVAAGGWAGYALLGPELLGAGDGPRISLHWRWPSLSWPRSLRGWPAALRRLAAQQPAQSPSSAGASSVFNTGFDVGHVRSTPAWSAACSASACWCSCSTAGCWG